MSTLPAVHDVGRGRGGSCLREEEVVVWGRRSCCMEEEAVLRRRKLLYRRGIFVLFTFMFMSLQLNLLR